MWEFDDFHEEHGRIPTQEEWENLCESWVHEYSLWADGYVWVVSDTTTGDSLAGIYAESEEGAIKYYTENYM